MNHLVGYSEWKKTYSSQVNGGPKDSPLWDTSLSDTMDGVSVFG